MKAKAEKPVAPKADKPKKAAAKSTKASSAKTAASPAAHKPINEDASVKAAEKAYADATLTANVPAEKMLNDMKKAVDVTVEAAVVEMNATTQLSERGIQDATMNLEALMTFQKEALDSLVGATVTAVQNIEELSDQMSDLAQQRSEKQAAFFSAFCEAKDPVSLCKVHEAYVRDSYDSMIAQYTASTDIWMRIGRESMDPLSTQFARMVDHMKGLSGQ
ncbi:hypothetical protein JCM17844_24730 [Iodidimonas gelatinilytica]|uniref:Phasin domain-containing protein n=1 Tax=Iodidimonas gelatinilytica TaxID=1236966 RepID=A0A5A7MSQ1_9PROT|nr:phasin family protein [Iodidimonas gelatinilytica]GEQ98836.1 hypothetical protein JCM17844_24730 [Iodidimonas gelatinilytica]GER01370.1 hypothetical protein JCM17845_19930 [Iodidimonas gelatinilytica]